MERSFWLGNVGVRIWMGMLLLSTMAAMIERGLTEDTARKYFPRVNPVETALDKCDFKFLGYKSVPPILNVQNPHLNGFKSKIVSRDGQRLLSAVTGSRCHFPGADEAEEIPIELAANCGKQFRMEADKLMTAVGTDGPTATDWYTTSMKGRYVQLPFTAVDLANGTRLRERDGNQNFPESRRCVTFLTATDLTTSLGKVLNKEHRKKLGTLGISAERLRSDFNLLVNNVLQFAQR